MFDAFNIAVIVAWIASPVAASLYRANRLTLSAAVMMSAAVICGALHELGTMPGQFLAALRNLF